MEFSIKSYVCHGPSDGSQMAPLENEKDPLHPKIEKNSLKVVLGNFERF